MPTFIAAIGGILLNIAGTFAGQMLIGLGIGAVTYTGLDIAMGFAKDLALSNLKALPADMVALLGYMKVGVSINIITSAIAARAGLNGMTSGAIKKFRIK